MHTSEQMNKNKNESIKKEITSKKPTQQAHHNATDKRWVWIPHPTKTFIKATIINETDNSIIAEDIEGTRKQVLKKEIQKMNPSKFDMIEDLACLSHLNEASVLNNLTMRFKNGLIYTYSGLFLLVVNPYRNLKIYSTHEMIKYSKSQKYELPPHIFAIANQAYNSMLINKEDQSILITGESGAGKTENTKKVINFLTFIAGNHRYNPNNNPNNEHNKLNNHKFNHKLNDNDHTINIEQQIINTNPILEAFGNAKTTRNDNSSRFGKFIKVEFDRGFIVGASIEKYLLEKSRVTKQGDDEQNYHIFYQLLSGADKKLRKELYLDFVSEDKKIIKPYEFKIVKNYSFKQQHVDDFNILISCLESLNFNKSDIKNIFIVLSTILHMGNINFKESNEQAEIENLDEVEIVCKLLNISITDFLKCILHPLSHAGNELVINQRNKEQASKVMEALCGIIYERLFEKVIQMINRAIYKTYDNYEHQIGTNQNNTNEINFTNNLKRVSRPSIINYNPQRTNFIGILDIAGFEIFKENDFEQFCINYTNEKLQQFFNHHMFILEQEIYRRENIDWNYIDFGKDLQPTIDLIEKNNPIGIFAFLDEECVMPGANDKTFFEKLKDNIKSEKFKVSRFNDQFQLEHYAGIVNYKVKEWIRKNKEPYFENLSELLSKSGNEFISNMFVNDNLKDKFVKKGYFRTLSQKHKEQLSILMKNLMNTNPHFVRCLLPNSNKTHDLVDNELVLKQLRCNGVLEGIRISRLGFPTRISFSKFVNRYKFLIESDLKMNKQENNKKVNDKENDDKENDDNEQQEDFRSLTKLIISNLKISPSLYRIGKTMVFFKMGVLADIEDLRDEKASLIAIELQSFIRRKLTIKKHLSTELKMKAQVVLKRNFLILKDLQKFSWWRLYLKIKPLLDIEKMEDEKREQLNKISQLEDDLEFFQNENNNLRTKINEIEFELERNKKEIEMSNLVINEKDELLVSMRDEKNNFENENKNLYLKNDEYKNEIEKLKKCIETKNQEFENEIKTMKLEKDSLKSENANLKDQINNKESGLNELKTILKNISDQNKSLLTENKNLKNKENELENKLLSQLTKDEEIQKIISEKENKIQTLENKNNTSIETINNLNLQLKEKDKLIKNIIEKNKLRKNKIKDFKNKILDLKTEVENEIKDEIKKSTSQIKMLNTKNCKNIQNQNVFISRQIKQIEELNEAIQRKEKEKEDLEFENETCQNTIRNSERNLRRQEIELKKLKDDVEMKLITINDLEKRINELTVINNNLNNDLNNKNENINNCDHKNENNKERESLLSKIKSLEKTNKKLTMLFKEEKMYNSQLKDELDSIHAENLSVMQKKFDELFKRESEMNSERKALTLKIKTLESENESLKLSIAEKINNIDESNNSSDGMFVCLEEERAKSFNLRKLLIEQENKNLELFNSIETIKNQYKDEIDEKNNEIEILKKNLQNLEKNKNLKNEIREEIQIIQSQVRLLSIEYQKIFLEKINYYKKMLIETENELKFKIDNYEIEKKEFGTIINSKNDEIEKLFLKIDELEMKMDKSVTELNNSLEHEIIQNKYLKNKNEILEKKINLIEIKRSAKDSQDRLLNLKNLSTKNEISKFSKEFDKKIISLTNECKELRHYKQKYETQLKLTETERERKEKIQKDFEIMKTEMTNLSNQLEIMKEKILNYEIQKKNLQDEIEILNKQIETKNYILKNHKVENDNVQQEMDSLRRVVNDLEIRIANIKIPEDIAFNDFKVSSNCCNCLVDKKGDNKDINDDDKDDNNKDNTKDEDINTKDIQDSNDKHHCSCKSTNLMKNSREEKFLARFKNEHELNIKNREIIKSLKDEIFELKRVINQNNISIKQLERDLNDKESLLGFYKTLSGKK
ncbi:putative myosin heavy chain [Dictyocoela muelleri]|nr:putative myosin heavy chain [Dictyocoela muelleri]